LTGKADGRGDPAFIAKQLPALIYLFEEEATQSTPETTEKVSSFYETKVTVPCISKIQFPVSPRYS